MNRNDDTDGSGARRGSAGSRFTWNGLLWSIIHPQRSHRIVPTVPGAVLVSLSMGIGMAAYNASSNILFLTLALLLACLVLSGVLSWLNLRKVSWRLRVAAALRVGHDTLVGLELTNGKRVLPTYGLWFNVRAQPQRPPTELRAETTLTARSADIRAALEQAEKSEVRSRITLPGRLDPGGELRLDWVFQPVRRGHLRLELVSVGSIFPFGFLRKEIGVASVADVIVWPAPVEYRRHANALARRQAGDERASRPGTGNDLIAVRRYNPGDSHRLIHWKASARTRQLLVRQFSAETAPAYDLWLRTDGGVWTRPEQFELLVSFAATLGEDLFRTGRLSSVSLDDTAPRAVRSVRDLELFLDALAVLEPRPDALSAGGPPVKANLLTFAPDGPRGVAALVDGQRIASA